MVELCYCNDRCAIRRRHQTEDHGRNEAHRPGAGDGHRQALRFFRRGQSHTGTPATRIHAQQVLPSTANDNETRRQRAPSSDIDPSSPLRPFMSAQAHTKAGRNESMGHDEIYVLALPHQDGSALRRREAASSFTRRPNTTGTLTERHASPIPESTLIPSRTTP